MARTQDGAMTCLGFLVPMVGGGGEFSVEPVRKKAPFLGPRGPSGSCDGGIGVDFSHTNTANVTVVLTIRKSNSAKGKDGMSRLFLFLF